ncbi:MAG: CHASE domain-containing protein [Magnetovibrio sp.]|nr:CHASE domain-containing protein [Magnetovibrio sp.]
MRQYPSFIFALLIALVVLAVVSVIDNQEMRALETADHDLVRKELNVVENELEAALNARLFHARGLAAFVVARPNFSMADFERFANAIQGRQKGVRSLQLSPNAYVTYITDHRRNRISLGENLLTDGPQLPLIRKAIDERRLIVAGPMELSQGGNAIIARQPIFLPAPGSGAEEFWGFATILIDVPPMLEEAGVLTPPPGIEFAIRGKDGLGAEGEVFHGLAATFSDNPNIAEVALPTGTWQIAAKRIGAVPGVARWRVWLWTGGGALAFVVGLLLYFMLREPAQLRAAVDDATAALRESQEALQRSEELYTRATLAGKVGVWDWNLDTDELYFSRDLEEMLGCGEGEYIRTF